MQSIWQHCFNLAFVWDCQESLLRLGMKSLTSHLQHESDPYVADDITVLQRWHPPICSLTCRSWRPSWAFPLRFDQSPPWSQSQTQPPGSPGTCTLYYDNQWLQFRMPYMSSRGWYSVQVIAWRGAILVICHLSGAAGTWMENNFRVQICQFYVEEPFPSRSVPGHYWCEGCAGSFCPPALVNNCRFLCNIICVANSACVLWKCSKRDKPDQPKVLPSFLVAPWCQQPHLLEPEHKSRLNTIDAEDSYAWKMIRNCEMSASIVENSMQSFHTFQCMQSNIKKDFH